MSVDHYENFPVASFLLPARLRPAVQVIYRFARTADDIADEGEATAAERRAALQAWQSSLKALEAGDLKRLKHDSPDPELFMQLKHVVEAHALPWQPFYDLLSAFEQDVTVHRYADDTELLDYCRRSANPVGALMLHLYKAATPENLALSDAICTGLQLVNFWQDVAIDWHKGRVYLPQQALNMHGLVNDDLNSPNLLVRSAAWQTLMRQQVAQARGLLLHGAPLACILPGRIGLELRLVVLGGLRILEKLDAVDYDVFTQRPTLNKTDWILLPARSLAYARTVRTLRADAPPLPR